MSEESQYKKYTLSLDGRDTFVYAFKYYNLKQAREDIKTRFGSSKITNIKPA
tara:strand:- start:788 stop:943 length:156 start_codon:yes stop_codon:yes gene_type:complete